MAHTHEHLEHAEHASHHAADPFNQRVAVSVAVVAALLAGLSMLGHRKHNEVLQLQGEANRLTTEASIAHTQSTDKWSEYQAVNVRDHGYEFTGGLLKEVAKVEPKYEAAFKDAIKKADGQHTKYKARLPEVKAEAEKLGHTGHEKQTESLQKMSDAHHSHHQADRLDVAHLGAEIGIVLCSLALLTKRKAFWLAGLGSAALAVVLAVTAYTMPHHPTEHSGAPAGASTDQGKPH
ncbi:DUF4337 domain-containing protein [Gemmata sp. JC717]|uniref:DUF4337 domain-containing protein n=1 Tax=Gemmata algarum TaxID=2975278 RepID=A0ABU5F0A3_9BACT|nr:DUF4337 domain-containing protein [Gemmata algarum]MDY3555121.1 DUF4337 domain-containing protein [Gemmata algarum]MDY3560992.1 DUF4337 domain-containing protein [Gemmata algarum]